MKVCAVLRNAAHSAPKHHCSENQIHTHIQILGLGVSLSLGLGLGMALGLIVSGGLDLCVGLRLGLCCLFWNFKKITTIKHKNE